MYLQYPAFVSPLLTVSGFDSIFVCGWFLTFTICMSLPVSLFICNIFVSSCGLFFSTWRSSFCICCKAGLVLLNSLSFCFSVKLLISPSNQNKSLAGWSNLGWRFFPCHHFKYIMPLPSGLQTFCRKKSADNLISVPLYVIYFFFLAAFNILSVITFGHFD